MKLIIFLSMLLLPGGSLHAYQYLEHSLLLSPSSLLTLLIVLINQTEVMLTDWYVPNLAFIICVVYNAGLD